MEKQENQRVKLTKRLFRESLIKMLKTENIYDISIRELCLNAGINRSTFYKYYGSQFVLLKEMEDEVLMRIENDLSLSASAQLELDPDSGHTILTNVLKFINENIDLVRILINSNVDTEFPQKLLYLPTIYEQVKKVIPDVNIKSEADYIYDFIVNGGYSMIKRWINKDNRETPEEMARILYRAFGKLIER